MAKPKHVRHSRRRVQKRGRKDRAGKKPKPVRYPGASFWGCLNIAGHRVPVFLQKQLDGGENAGTWMPDTEEIYILQGMPEDLTEDTVLHEVIHAISTICMTPAARLSEEQVNTLATQLRDTMDRNKSVKWHRP